jgi:hypothetical protein
VCVAPPRVNHNRIFPRAFQPLNALAQVTRLEKLNFNAHVLRVCANAGLDVSQRAPGAALQRVSNRARSSE